MIITPCCAGVHEVSLDNAVVVPRFAPYISGQLANEQTDIFIEYQFAGHKYGCCIPPYICNHNNRNYNIASIYIV